MGVNINRKPDTRDPWPELVLDDLDDEVIRERVRVSFDLLGRDIPFGLVTRGVDVGPDVKVVCPGIAVFEDRCRVDVRC